MEVVIKFQYVVSEMTYRFTMINICVNGGIFGIK